MAQHLDIGRQGEALAEAYLKQKGYKVLDRNVANPLGKRLGEIDIIARDKGTIVFVEVKTLQAHPGGDEYLPEWQVTRSKLAKLERIAEYYLRNQGQSDAPYRFDVVAITLREGQAPAMRHIEHAFL